MAWRLDHSVVRGELDSRERGRVTGRIWLAGRTGPIRLELEGNPWRDLAGCLVQFTNPAPKEGDAVDLNACQRGAVGDITGSRKVRVPDVPIEEMMRLSREGKKFPEHMGNCLTIEWFSQANGRVVIESTDYQVTVSAPGWKMTAEEEQAQFKSNRQALRAFLENLAGPRPDEDSGGDEDPGTPEPSKPMNEFEWEKFMKESDKRTDRYMELLKKYEDHPDREKLVAREMGWDTIEEALEAGERGLPGTEEDEPPEAPAWKEDEDGDMTPNPLTEGVDWVRDEHGHLQHPLVLRTIGVVMAMWHACDEAGLLGEPGSPEVQEMLFQTQTTGAKLAGGLNSLAYDTAPEGGFVVACLKRALTYLHKAIGLADTPSVKSAAPAKELAHFRQDLFAIRTEILRLMERYRAAPG